VVAGGAGVAGAFVRGAAYDYLWGVTVHGSVADAEVVHPEAIRDEVVDVESDADVATVAMDVAGESAAGSVPEPADVGATLGSPEVAPLGDAGGAGIGGHGSSGIEADGVGSLWLSTGQVFAVDRPLVFGRSPAPRPGRLAEAVLVAVPSPQSDISRNHLAVWREDGTLLARDLGSTNGTLLRRPDRAPSRVGADAPTLVRPGDVYDLGDGVTVTVGGAR
jgi:hypothetical protein